MAQGTSMKAEAARDELVEAVVAASRVLVAIAARSLADRPDDVTLPQYRLLVVLTTEGPHRVSDLAANLDVNPSTATRLSDRLEAKGLVERQRMPTDRRAVQLVATAEGRRVVDEVMADRRVEIGRVLATMSPEQQREVAEGLSLFSASAGEVPDRHWTVGWQPPA